MTFVIAAPEIIASAASDLSGIRSMIAAADAAAATSTSTVLAAAGDEVSAAIASLFSSHGQAYQSMSAQAAAFNHQFVQALSSAGFSYADVEAVTAASLRTVGQDLLGEDRERAAANGSRVDRFRWCVRNHSVVPARDRSDRRNRAGGNMNTGYQPFLQNPVYIGYSPSGFGTTVFDTSANL